MASHRHRPQRTCLGCGHRDDQKSLIRITIGAQGELVMDAGPGRGGYLHHRHDCWEAFLRRKNTHRAFRVNISRDVRHKLIQVLKENYRE